MFRAVDVPMNREGWVVSLQVFRPKCVYECYVARPISSFISSAKSVLSSVQIAKLPITLVYVHLSVTSYRFRYSEHPVIKHGQRKI